MVKVAVEEATDKEVGMGMGIKMAGNQELQPVQADRARVFG